MLFSLKQETGPVRPNSAGFTLVEIALAVGIFAFAIVGILSLFPVGLRSANESRVETVVSQIARSVISDLRTPPLFDIVNNTPPTPPTVTPVKNPLGEQMGTFKAALVAIKQQAGISQNEAFETIDLSKPAPQVFYLAYLADGTVKGKLDAGPYATGNASADYIVKLETRLVAPNAPYLAQVTVTVEAPAAAPVLNRTSYAVVTLIGESR